MKISILVLIFGSMVLAAAAAWADKWDAQWKKVDDAVNNGLPKTAIEQLQPILDGAIAAKDYPVAIKAIGRKIALEGVIQGNKPEEKITRLDAEIAKAPAEMQPMLEVIQAQWYWQYFLHNRWRFMQRTATSAPPGKDFTTWDLPRLFAEIDKHFQKALAAADQLKKIPVADYNDLLGKRLAAGHLPPHALRLRGPSGAGLLQLGRAGRRQGGGRLRAGGRRPDLPAGRGVHRLEARSERYRLGNAQGDEALPAVARLPSERRRQDGLPRCRSPAADAGQQQGCRRRQGDALQSWPCGGSSSSGATPSSRPWPDTT